MQQRYRLDGKHFFFTYPRCELLPTSVLEKLTTKVESKGKHVVLHAIGRELHADGFPHIHAYLCLDTRINIRDAHFWDLDGFHGNYQTCRSAKGVIKYVTKDNNFIANFDTKDLVPMSKREIGKKLIKGEKLQDIVVDFPQLVFEYGRLKNNIALYALDQQTPYTHYTTRGVWIWGEPGTGKTTLARSWIGKGEPYIKPQNKWWDGYTGQWTVVLDDLDTGVLGHYIKIWADRWGCSGEVKGGTIPLLYRVFIVTSNYHPMDLWNDDKVDNSAMRHAIIRRFIFIKK